MHISEQKASVTIHRFLRNSLYTWWIWDAEEFLDMLAWWKLEYDEWVQDHRLVANHQF